MIQRVDTKEIIAESFLELVRKQPIKKIRVLDIVSNCSMSRESFYYHFNDKYELMFWIYDKHLGKMIDDSIVNRSIIETQVDILEIMQRYKFFYKAVLFDDEFSERLLKIYVSNIEKCVVAKLGADALKDPDIDFSIHFYANGLLQMEKKWIAGTGSDPIEEIAARICNIMPANIRICYTF